MIAWAVYEHPKDWPEHFVVRPWAVMGEVAQMVPNTDAMLFATRDEARAWLTEQGLLHIQGIEQADPVIVETWA